MVKINGVSVINNHRQEDYSTLTQSNNQFLRKGPFRGVRKAIRPEGLRIKIRPSCRGVINVDLKSKS